MSTATPSNWLQRAILFLTSQTISLFGSMLVQYAIIWHITLTAKSGAVQTIAILAGFIPTFLISPFGGVWADRYNRRFIMAGADAFIAIITLIAALLFQSGHQELWLLFIVLGLRAVGTAIHTPAVSAFIPQLVPAEKLTAFNGYLQSIQSAVMLASPILAAFLLSVAPLQTIFYIDLATAALAIAILMLLPVPAHAKASSVQSTSYLHDLKQGFAYIKGHAYVTRYFLFCTAFFFMAAPVAFLTPLQVVRNFGPEVWRLSAIEIVFSIGMMGGGILMATWGGFRNRVHTMVLSSLVFGITTLALGLLGNFPLYLLAMGLCGLGMPLFNTPSTVLLQEQVESDYQGRVFGVLGMISSIMMPMGMLVFGPLADTVSIESMLIGTGIAMMLMGLAMTRSKELVRHGEPATPQSATTSTLPGELPAGE